MSKPMYHENNALLHCTNRTYRDWNEQLKWVVRIKKLQNVGVMADTKIIKLGNLDEVKINENIFSRVSGRKIKYTLFWTSDKIILLWRPLITYLEM